MIKDSFCIKFTISKNGELFCAKNNAQTVMSCTFDGQTLDFRILYDFKADTPLHLTSAAMHGDKIAVNILAYRIELYVGGALTDEEWPCGKHFVTDSAQITDDCGLNICDPIEPKKQEPCVISSFDNAEGWKPEGGVFVGDCMPYVHEGRYHVLYLKDRHHHHSKWRLGAHQWSHISTDDFKRWDIHPMAVEIDDPNEGSICTGSWICDGAKQYLFYTVRACDGSPAQIRRSVSTDGCHFEKDKDFCFTLSDKYTAPSARDPKIVKDGDGVYHMILTTTLTKEKKGCLAHLTSKDLTVWRQSERELFVAETVNEPECPDYFRKDGYYYLVYSLCAKGYYLYSTEPFSGWKAPKNPIIPCKSVPKAGIWNDRIIFTGFDGGGVYGGTMTFLEAFVRPDGELAFEK